MFRRRCLRCSFCGKSEAAVAKLVAGPRVYICDECVALAGRIMERDAGAAPRPPEARPGLLRRLWDRVARARHPDPGGPWECHAVARSCYGASR
jgi:hypothetical protein